MTKYVNIKITEDGGCACGPCGGSTYVEVEVEKENKQVYVLVCSMDGFENVVLFPSSVIEIISGADCDYDFEKLLSSAIINFDNEETELDEMINSGYYSAIKLARMAMKEASPRFCEGYEDIISKFNSNYCDIDLDSIEIPEIKRHDLNFLDNFVIKSVKCDTIGPLEGIVVAEVELESENGIKLFYSLAEADGMPNIMMSNESTFEAQIGKADDDAIKVINESIIFSGEYEEIFDDHDNIMMQLFRYLIYIVRSDWDDCKEFINNTIGCCINEINIPVSDLEEEYLDNCEV